MANQPKDPQNLKGALRAQYSVTPTSFHTHNGSDSPRIKYKDIQNTPAATTSPIYAGFVASTGTAGSFFPAGWTASKLATGQYQLTHKLGSTNYSVVAISPDGNFASYDSPAANTVNIFTYNFSGGAEVSTDSDFMFILTTQANP